MTGGAVVGYAFTIGLVGLLNPCGFPLLPAYLALFLGGAEDTWGSRLWSGLKAGGCLTAGFVAVFGVIGLAASSVSAAVAAIAPWLMVVVGVGMIAYGVAALVGRAPTLRMRSLPFRGGRSAPAMVGFGVAYALGSLSCSLPIFLAGVGGAFSTNAPLRGLAAFVAYGLGMGLFVTAASVLTALAGNTVLRMLRPASAVLPRIAAAVCVVVGLYLTGYWWSQIGGTLGPITGIAADVDAAQSAIASWLDAWWLPTAAACSLVVIAALLIVAMEGGRRSSAPASAPARAPAFPPAGAKRTRGHNT